MEPTPWGIPSLAELAQYNVNRPDQVEAIRQSLYDTQTYAQAGQTNLTFFQVPQSSSKFLDDTNMEAAGALPAPKSFLIETLELYFFPAVAEIAGSGAVTLIDDFIKDVYNFGTKGWLELFIGSKPYLDEAPLMKFPARCGLSGWSALAQSITLAADQHSWISYASLGGPTYQLSPPILLVPTQNFKITLNWPTAVAITAAAAVKCSLGGILYRNSQ